MPFFPNHTLEIYEYNENSEELNPYNEPVAEYSLVDTVAVDFQTTGTNDVLLESGETLTDTYKAYIPSNTIIKEGMKFKIKNQPHTYTLIGHEIVNSRFTPTQHIKLVLQIDRKASL